MRNVAKDDGSLTNPSKIQAIGNSVARPRVYRFGAFTLDSRTGELTMEGSKTALREQPLQLLLALLEQPGELVTRDTLVNRLWPAGTFVDFDRGLNKAVNHLREALKDSVEQPHFIETLPRKGYRFIAQVTHEDQQRAEHPPGRVRRGPRRTAWFAAFATALTCMGIAIVANTGGVRNWLAGRWRPTPEIVALAVIPLENLSHDPEQEYFADGMTDALITDLAKMVKVRITSRTSIMRYKGTKKNIKEIGRELNVDAVIEGTVTRSENRVRITAQLIQVSTDMHLWAEAYEQEVGEVLTLQREVATDIARRINILVRPLERAGRVNPQAYGLYLKGRYFFNQYTNQGWRQSIEFFNQAIANDPKFAPAYSGLADAYLVAGAYGAIPTQEALTRGKAAAAVAIQLDDNLASAHYALATAYTWYDWAWAEAEKEFHRALELDPNDALGRNWYGGYLSLHGRHDEAIEAHEQARELDPFSLIINANLARAFYWARRYDEAIVQSRKTLEMDPKFGVALFWLEGALRHKNLLKEAVALRQAASPPDKAQLIGRTFKAGGFDSLMRESGETFKKNGALVEAARCYAQIGQTDEALAILEDCYGRRCSSMATLKVEPDFDVLQPDVRFQNLLQKMGLL
jgi:TolB-like protein/DNA-binding winged helix-turn-helix (wHTH) protein/tetratricopeptide (TPR) repeat protein